MARHAPESVQHTFSKERVQVDNSVLGLWGISLCTSLAGCLALTAWKIRRRE